jgi:putative tricarboxylic transport membrane protein
VTGDRWVALGLAAFGLFIAGQAWRLPYWLDRSPGPGFVPLWLGIVLTISAGGVFVRARTPHEEPGETLPDRSNAIALAAITTVAAAAVPLTGLIAATAVLTAAAAWKLDPGRRIAIGAATLATPLLVWLIFGRWLGVPLP